MNKSELKEPWAPLLDRLKIEVKRVYGNRLITLAIFGSLARGTATVESDIDLLIVAIDLPKGRTRRVSEFDQAETALESEMKRMAEKGFHTYLSPLFKTPDEVRAGSPLFLDMVFDILILYDRHDFFKKFLDDFKRRLDSLGARRIVQGDRWYWDLKPDYKPGDIIKL